MGGAHACVLRRRHPRLAGHVPEVPRGRGVLRRRRARVRGGPHGQGARPDRPHERRLPRVFPRARRGDRRRWAPCVHRRPRAARLLLEGLRSRGVRGRRTRSDGEARSVSRAGLGAAGRMDRARRGGVAPDGRPHVPDRWERRRAVRAGDARAARRRSRGRERGSGGRAGRRAHDDHGGAVDADAVGHPAGGERGGDRSGDRAGLGVGARRGALRVQPPLSAEGHPDRHVSQARGAARRAAPADPGGRTLPHDRRREHGGARGDRALPAARRAPRAHPRIGGSLPDRPDPDVQPRERVRARCAAGSDRRACEVDGWSPTSTRRAETRSILFGFA